jgi:hypothetical protein
MMHFPIRRRNLILSAGVIASLVAGCGSPQPAAPVNQAAKSGAPASSPAEEIRRVAEAALGMQAEVVAHGDLARNGLEQLLVVNRFQQATRGNMVSGDPARIWVTRAAIIQKDSGKWTEVLRCDEHLKNPNGYLGGSPTAPVTGWKLEIAQKTQQGLEMKFTPADEGQPIAVRWNTKTKRYQSLDQSHERYLSEAPTLATPQSVLR